MLISKAKSASLLTLRIRKCFVKQQQKQTVFLYKTQKNENFSQNFSKTSINQKNEKNSLDRSDIKIYNIVSPIKKSLTRQCSDYVKNKKEANTLK